MQNKSVVTGALITSVLILLGAWIVFTRLSLSYDLAFFLPPPTTAEQRLLVDQLGQGPGTDLLFVVVPHLGDETASEQRLEQVREGLLSMPGITRVLPGNADNLIADIPTPVWDYRYLIDDTPIDESSLAAALAANFNSSFLDPQMLSLLAEDPLLTSLDILAKNSAVDLSDPNDSFTDTSNSYLVVEPVASAFDLSAQQRLLQAVREQLAKHQAASSSKPIRLLGAGVYGDQLQKNIQGESIQRTSIAGGLLLLLLYWAYRRWSVLPLVMIPLLAGALGGLAVLALMFQQVHGITLAFGFTLFGVAVDYVIHLFSHARASGEVVPVWRTLWYAVFSSSVAYFAFIATGSVGLIQLGIFSGVGIVLVALVSRLFITPLLSEGVVTVPIQADGEPAYHRPSHRLGRQRLHSLPWILLLATAVGSLWLANSQLGAVWNNNLASLTPIPEQTLAEDRALRQSLGAPEMRYLIALQHNDQQQLLQHTEQLNTRLQQAQQQEWISGFQNVSQFVPSLSKQQQRKQHLQALNIESLMRRLVTDSNFHSDAFKGFIDAVNQQGQSEVALTAAAFDGTAVQRFVETHLYQREYSGDWVSLTTLTDMRLVHIEQLRAMISVDGNDVQLVDLKNASESLLVQYRSQVGWVLCAALGMIALVLAVGLRDLSRSIWIVGVLLATVAATIALARWFIGGLSLFDLMATTLVAGLTLDYALFCSAQKNTQQEQANTRHALAICAMSTFTVFALLATSSIPLLHGIGVTVTAGVIVGYCLTHWSVSWRVSANRPAATS